MPLILVALAFTRIAASQDRAIAPSPRWSKRAGRVRVFENGTLKRRDLLSLEDILTPKENLALTSIAVPTTYSAKKLIYLSYTDAQGDIVVGRFELNDTKTLDSEDLQVVLKVVQPIPHNERSFIAFGPDGYLYVALGDTADKKGAEQHAQDLRSPFGKILRIDVSNPDRYTVPKDNPPKKESDRMPEIWAIGFQNPLHLAFDPLTKAPFLIDAGDTTQEINKIERDKNYGWNVVEGAHCVKNPCDTKPFTPALFEYPRSSDHPIIGGIVYQGSFFPALKGSYLFVNPAMNTLNALREESSHWTAVQVASISVPLTALGEGTNGEIFATTYAGDLIALTPNNEAQEPK
jgi:glucose/arabinose dehydrogenase